MDCSKKKIFLLIIVVVLIICGIVFLVAAIGAEEWKGDFCFIQGTDPQFGWFMNSMSGKCDVKNLSCYWEIDMKLSETAIEKVYHLKPRPKFFIITGDLTNELPEDDQKIRSAQIADFKNVFGKIITEIPLFLLPGNHDVSNAPTEETILSYRSTYSKDYYSFSYGGVVFIALNSQYFKNSTYVSDFARQQEEWLDEQLAEARGKRIIGFAHIPWFVSDVEEDTEYFNIPIQTRKRVLNKLYDAGVRHMFFGHLHKNIETKYKDMEIVVTSAIGGTLEGAQSGLRIVTVSRDSVTHRFYNYSDFPDTITFD